MSASLPAAVLFDMDGTLVDTEGLWLDAEVHVMGELGAQWTVEDQAFCLGGPLERVAEYMLRRSGSGMPPEEVGTRLLDAMEERLRRTPLEWRPGARAALVACLDAGVPTALVSASWTRLIAAVDEKLHEDLGRAAFTAVVAGDDVTRSKPHPEPYLLAAATLRADPADCLALEDSPTGVRSARDAGCRVIAIPHLAPIDLDGVVVIDTLAGRSLPDLWSLSAG